MAAAYLMVTTSPGFSRLHTSSTAGNENFIPYFQVALLFGFVLHRYPEFPFFTAEAPQLALLVNAI